jgi:hypothetical protein
MEVAHYHQTHHQHSLQQPPQQHLEAKPRNGPMPEASAGLKRAREEKPQHTLPAESTSSKRSRAEKHYKEIRLLCDALAPHIDNVQVKTPLHPSPSEFIRRND